MSWKTDVALSDLPLREALIIKVNGLWEPTTPYELLNTFRFPRFLTLDQVEFAMNTEIWLAREKVACPV